ncbi:MAG: Flp family type IVb pilin [Pseudomonadota bacterium]
MSGRTRRLTAALATARHLWADRRGGTQIEYALIVGLIFLAIVAAVRSYADATSLMYNEIETNLSTTTP